MLFLPYEDYIPENCNKHGYRYSMSNCVFESAFEATLKTCECYPIFHEDQYQRNTYELLKFCYKLSTI